MSGQERIHKELLEILVCPLCRGKVELQGKHLECKGCGKRYPVRDGIPDMTADSSEGPESGG